jgi:antitoxin FitA
VGPSARAIPWLERACRQARSVVSISALAVVAGLLAALSERGALDMCATCFHVWHMPKMIQLRHVPDQLHRALKARAAVAGLSLSAYLIGELKRSADRLPIEELRARLARLEPVAVKESPADVLRGERDGR